LAICLLQNPDTLQILEPKDNIIYIAIKRKMRRRVIEKLDAGKKRRKMSVKISSCNYLDNLKQHTQQKRKLSVFNKQLFKILKIALDICFVLRKNNILSKFRTT